MISINEFKTLHPQDRRTEFNKLEINQQKELLNVLDPLTIAELFEYLDDDDVISYFSYLKTSIISDVLNYMDNDDVTRIVRKLDDTTKNFYLNIVDDVHYDIIKHLLSYSEDEIGSLMEKRYLFIEPHQTVEYAIKIIINKAQEISNIHYMYVLDKSKELLGVVSLKQLFLEDYQMTMEQIMQKKIISVLDTDDKQIAAKVIKDYDFYAIPIVNKNNQMQGIIVEEDVIDILFEDAKDNYEQLSGVQDVSLQDTTIQNILTRLPWMLILLIFTSINSMVYSNFSNILTVSIVASIMPLVASISGNVGVQALGITIYKLSSDGYDSVKSILSHTFNEMKIYFYISLIINFFAFIILVVILKQYKVGLVIVLTFSCTFVSSSLFGSLIPIILDRLKINTSVASGPLISTINDLISISIYLSISSIILL